MPDQPTRSPPMPDILPNKELHAAILAEAQSAECIDPVLATAKAIEAFTRGEFADADQVSSWFSLQRVKQPDLWSASTDGPADFTTAEHVGRVSKNPFSPNYKGPDRNKAISVYIKEFGTAAA